MRPDRNLANICIRCIDTTPLPPETWEDWIVAFTGRITQLFAELSHKITTFRQKSGPVGVQSVDEYALEVC